MANNFKAFEYGLRIAPGLTSDPITGKLGEIYWNSTNNVLRICVDTAPLTWVDLFLQPGTVEDATLAWNDSTKKWEENSQLLINNNEIYTPSDITGVDLLISSGDSTGGGPGGIAASQPSSNANYNFTGGTNLFGQTFTPSISGTLDEIDIRAFDPFVLSGSIVMDIYNTAAGLPTGPILTTSTNVLDIGTLPGSATIFTFTFTGLSLVSGTQYAFVLRDLIGTGFGGNVPFNYQNSDVYAGGSRITNTGVWVAEADDLRFEVRLLGSANNGADIVFKTGDSIGGGDQGKIRIDALGIYGKADTAGYDLNIKGGEATGGNNDGGDLLLSGGDPDGTGKIGDVVLTGQRIGIRASSATAPLTGTVGDIYYNSLLNRFAKYGATGYHWIETGKGITPLAYVDIKDDTQITLPATTATTLDGQTVVDGQLVLFTNLSSNNNRVYHAAVSGINITWTLVALGQNGTGVATLGDHSFVKLGTNNAQKLYYFNGTSWILLLESISNRINQDRSLYIAKGGTKVWTPASNTLSWSASAFVQVNGLLDTRNEISAGSVVLANDNDVAYVTINRSGATPAILTVTVTNLNSLSTNDLLGSNIVILARRIDASTIIWGSKDQEKSSEQKVFIQKTLTDATSGNVFSELVASYTSLQVEYSIVRGSNTESGVLYISSDGTTAGVSGVFQENGSTGVSFSASVVGINLLLDYTTTATGTNATMRYIVKKWLA